MDLADTRRLRVMAPTRYPWRFNGPRHSRHAISVRPFLPFNYLSPALDGITIFSPFPWGRPDLIHAFNRIPVGTLPFLIGFESHLPRAFGLEDTAYFRALRRRLASPACRAIVAISDYARRQFLRQHAGCPDYDRLVAKLRVRYPNLPLPRDPDGFPEGEGLRLVFVGNHFGRKGGAVAVRLAELAFQAGIPLTLDVVSSFEVGEVSWTDPTQPGYFEPDRRRLALPNVRNHGALANEAVLALVRQAHFTLLPTFSDSFGYSVIEAMAQGTPAVVTRQAALPEFVHDGVNGIVLPLPTDAAGEWREIGRADRGSTAYATLYRQEINRLADLALSRIVAATADRSGYLALRDQARRTAAELFCAEAANRFWDDFYCRLVDGPDCAAAGDAARPTGRDATV